MSRVLFIQADSRLLNPNLDEEMIAAAYSDDAEAARSEWGGDFRSDLSQFLADDIIDRAITLDCLSRPRLLDCLHVGFCDPSGGARDDMTLCIAHQERGGRVVLDKLLAVSPPFEPDEVVANFAQALSAYGLMEVTGDRYGGEWVPAAFRKHGITYRPSQLAKSDIYIETLPLFMQGLVQLIDSPKLETQLRLLERRPRAGGKDIVDHPRSAHDDLANACAGALWLASKLQWAGQSMNQEPINRAMHLNGTNYDPWDRGLGKPFSAEGVVYGRRH
jgi:hypothetical protein